MMDQETCASSLKKLEGMSNYSTWKFAMKMRLMNYDVWEAVEPGNLDLTKLEDRKANSKALSTICLGIQEKIDVDVNKCTTAKEAWKILERNFQSSGLLHLLQLKKEIMSFKLEDFPSTQDYITKICTVAQQISSIDETDMNDKQIALIMLMGLPKSYDPLVITLGYSGNALESEKVKSVLLHEESRRDTNVEPFGGSGESVCFSSKTA